MFRRKLGGKIELGPWSSSGGVESGRGGGLLGPREQRGDADRAMARLRGALIQIVTGKAIQLSYCHR